ncbi:hypothetical protein NDA03_26415 [Trichocoleus sp. Lan]|uniref:hypothetical protein n=1 Tax=Trichocoleus sp. Lan TaxID=2933927 RepID=UPI0032983723
MLPTDLLPKAQQIIDRLVAINYENPQICEQRIRDAFSRHLIALNQRDRFVEIYRSFYAAFDAAWEDTYDATWKVAMDAAERAVCNAAMEAARQAASDAISHFKSNAAMEAAREAAFDVASHAASDVPHFGAVQTAQEAACNAALRAVNKTASDPLWNAAWNGGFDIAFALTWQDAREAVKKVAKGAALKTGWDDVWNAAFGAGWKTASGYGGYAADRAYKSAEDAAGDTPRCLAWDATKNFVREAALVAALDGDWNAAGKTGTEASWAVAMAVEIVNSTTSSPEHDQFCAVWMPFVDAIEAGLFYFWVTPSKVIVLTTPVMRIEDDRLHADGQPAVQWSDWEGYYFWRGTQISQKYGAVLFREWRYQ